MKKHHFWVKIIKNIKKTVFLGQKTLLVRKIIKKHDFWGKKWVGDQKQGKKRQKTAFLG